MIQGTLEKNVRGVIKQQKFDFAGYKARLQSLYYHNCGSKTLSSIECIINENYMRSLAWKDRQLFYSFLMKEGEQHLADYFEQKYLIPKSLKGVNKT